MTIPCYLYSSPSGGIELIEGDKMPVMPVDICGPSEVASCYDRLCHEGRSKTYCFKRYHYEQEIERAKASGIHVKDQERAKAMIREQYRFVGDLRLDYVYGPFNISYEILEACGNDSCAMDAGCEHCQKPVKVAILLPESKLPEKGQRETFNMLFCQYFDLIKAGHSEHTTVTELMEHFTITRKQ